MKQRLLICFYTSNYEDILEKGVAKEYENFLEAGFFNKVIFVCPIARRSLSTNHTNNVEIRQIGWHSDRLNTHLNLLLKYPIFFLRLLWFTFALLIETLLLKRHYSVIFRSTDPFFVGTYAWLVSFICRVPLVVSIHSNYDFTDQFLEAGSRIKLQLRFVIQKFVLTQSTLILVIRKNIGDNISLQAPKLKRKIRLIPHGVDTLTIDRISNHSLDPTKNSVTISFVGRLSPENFVYDIVLLGAMLRDIGLISFEILIVGDGPLKDELATKIKRANLHDKIKLVGFLGFEEVIKIRKRSISFVPMGGMSLLEAMASKSATIAYDIDWHNEIIESGVNGYLVSQADLASAAKLVVALAQEPSARVIVGDRAHRTITEGYSRISSINHKIAHYKEILSLKNEN